MRLICVVVHQAFLADLLGIGRRFGGALILDSKLRARLLLQFVEGAETDPSEEAANLNLLLSELSIRHGRDAVKAHLKEVEGCAEKVVDEALAPSHLDKFIKELGIKPNSAGDHW